MAVPRGKEAIVGGFGRGSSSKLPWRCCPLSGSITVTYAVRLLLVACIVLLSTFVAVTYPVLGAGGAWSVSFANWRRDHGVIETPSPWPKVEEIGNSRGGPEITTFNESFLAFAANDPVEESEKRKIRMILDGKVEELRNAHNKWSYQRRMDHYIDLDESPRRVRPRYESWLLQLQSPKFAPSWSRFQKLLQGWSRYKHYDPAVMQDLVQLVKDPIDQFYSARGHYEPVQKGTRYRTCAVVGNSGILLNQRLGDFIDSHDMVMRLNNAKISGFEEFVGSKTTMSFVNSNIYHACSRRLKCFCHPYGEVPLVMYLCQVQHMMDVAVCESHHRAPVLVTDPRLDNLCGRLVRWYSVKRFVEMTGNPTQAWEKEHNIGDFHYSSGFQATVLALGICDKVDIVGFGKSVQAKHHYHTNQKAELDLHDYAAEYQFYDDLVNNRSSSIPFLTEAGYTIPWVQMFR